MKQLLILSGKGGTGKTTVATAFIRLSDAKAYADCDVDAPNLHLLLKPTEEDNQQDYFGLDKAVIDLDKCTQCGLCESNCRFDAIYSDQVYHIDAYACEGCGVCQMVCPEHAISLRPEKAGDLLLYKGDALFSTAQLKMGNGTSGKLVTEVKKQLVNGALTTPFAIIDGSPGIGCPVIASLSGVDLVLIVAEPTISGISDMNRIIATARKFQVRTAVCINKYDVNLENTTKIIRYCEETDCDYLGNIPYDASAVVAINNGLSIVDIPCEAGRAVKAVYEKTFHLLGVS